MSARVCSVRLKLPVWYLRVWFEGRLGSRAREVDDCGAARAAVTRVRRLFMINLARCGARGVQRSLRSLLLRSPVRPGVNGPEAALVRQKHTYNHKARRLGVMTSFDWQPHQITKAQTSKVSRRCAHLDVEPERHRLHQVLVLGSGNFGSCLADHLAVRRAFLVASQRRDASHRTPSTKCTFGDATRT